MLRMFLSTRVALDEYTDGGGAAAVETGGVFWAGELCGGGVPVQARRKRMENRVGMRSIFNAIVQLFGAKYESLGDTSLLLTLARARREKHDYIVYLKKTKYNVRFLKKYLFAKVYKPKFAWKFVN